MLEFQILIKMLMTLIEIIILLKQIILEKLLVEIKSQELTL